MSVRQSNQFNSILFYSIPYCPPLSKTTSIPFCRNLIRSLRFQPNQFVCIKNDFIQYYSILFYSKLFSSIRSSSNFLKSNQLHPIPFYSVLYHLKYDSLKLVSTWFPLTSAIRSSHYDPHPSCNH